MDTPSFRAALFFQQMKYIGRAWFEAHQVRQYAAIRSMCVVRLHSMFCKSMTLFHQADVVCV